MTNLFVQPESQTGAQHLKTAELTTIATQIALGILKTIEETGDQYVEMVTESQQTHEAMDKLLSNFQIDVNLDFLRTEDDDSIDKMIKSQQSKRSKAKNARMTLDNYRTLMTAAIAENLLRTVANKPKAKTGNTKTSALDFTEDYLQYLTTDQDKLRREIRNIQSKKSIEKAKPDFDETSDRWQQLLSIEEILKSIRVDIEPVARPKKVDERLTKIAELLDKNIDILKAAESKELLKQIAVVLAPAEPEQVPEAEVVTEETTGDAE